MTPAAGPSMVSPFSPATLPVSQISAGPTQVLPSSQRGRRTLSALQEITRVAGVGDPGVPSGAVGATRIRGFRTSRQRLPGSQSALVWQSQSPTPKWVGSVSQWCPKRPAAHSWSELQPQWGGLPASSVTQFGPKRLSAQSWFPVHRFAQVLLPMLAAAHSALPGRQQAELPAAAAIRSAIGVTAALDTGSSNAVGSGGG